MRSCCIKGCFNKRYCKSFCIKHYQRVVKWGDPLYLPARHHGMTDTPEYHIWGNMIQRCTNPNHPKYADYGGRGIKVCERWLSFLNFYTDVGTRPSEKYSIDRINVDGDYEPENVRWATKSQQQLNRRPQSATGYKNIYHHSGGFMVRRARKYIGWFKTLEQAKHALSIEGSKIINRIKGELPDR